MKDPFFAMTRRSLNTYMNALTGQDFTCYPAASQVLKDFYNLLDVYLDAVFQPNLQPLQLYSRGASTRVQRTLRILRSSIEHKGIVFNEMKGAHVLSGTRHASRRAHAALFPNTTYGLILAADPRTIPELTYERIDSVPPNFYHPSRCLFFFYGISR